MHSPKRVKLLKTISASANLFH